MNRRGVSLSSSHKIPKRSFGRYDDQVSIIAMGGGHIVRPGVTDDEAIKVIHAAIDAGVTFIDTAWDYGEGLSEQRIGMALEGRDDKLFIATKVCSRDGKEASKQINESLERLKTDSVDLISIHELNYDNDPEWVFEEGGVMESLIEAREQGKTKYIGFTGHKRPEILLEMLKADIEWDSCQMPINVMDSMFRSFENQVLPILTDRGIACIGMKSLGGNGQIVTDAGLTAQQCRTYSLSQPITTLSCGMVDIDNVQQDTSIGATFTPMTDDEQEALRASVRREATDGRHEWFKTNNFFDNWYHREQHGYPVHADVRSALGLK